MFRYCKLVQETGTTTILDHGGGGSTQRDEKIKEPSESDWAVLNQDFSKLV